jgi:protein TonB
LEEEFSEMLAYAANRPVVAKRGSSPNAMLVIIGVHVAVIAAVMSAKMDLPAQIRKTPLFIDFIRPPEPPPTPQVQSRLPTQPHQSVIDRTEPLVPTPSTTGEILDSTPTPLPNFDDLVRPLPNPVPDSRPTPAPKSAARLLTSGEDLKPAYPVSKIASGEEAVLRLRLPIDASGRVIDVEPVGRADPAFLQAARRHLLAHWRYKPASEGGRAIVSFEVVTLHFQLEG